MFKLSLKRAETASCLSFGSVTFLYILKLQQIIKAGKVFERREKETATKNWW
jgi:hypothetical protein